MGKPHFKPGEQLAGKPARTGPPTDGQNRVLVDLEQRGWTYDKAASDKFGKDDPRVGKPAFVLRNPFAAGRQTIIVGPLWTTIATFLYKDCAAGEYYSVKTEDLDTSSLISEP